MKNFKNMLKQAQEMQQKLQDAQANLANVEVEGNSGGGMVKILMNGKGNLRKITLDKSLLNPDEADILEDLIVAAFNDAKSKSDNLNEDTMGNITSGLQLPDNFKLPF